MGPIGEADLEPPLGRDSPVTGLMFGTFTRQKSQGAYVYLQVYSAACRDNACRSSGQTKNRASTAPSLSCFGLCWLNMPLIPGVSLEDCDSMYIFAKHTIDRKFSIR